ncbi:ABC transporter substrate-binding protein [Amycolatopsis jiangsuensis]|uniref:Iron complex transport system substrate-binding protein n=1 Tax=Amycolatopsis jiangsuensis TaxID=1181879 RepID=A0A840IUP1_9PSEU|nr:ABC transporter substrate-binding protein [Amycolatopsis jiangsuensis]MBB4685503.1 iron complex transport system substrate-binding protein [Amycolatopsis jiangsuensis]
MRKTIATALAAMLLVTGCGAEVSDESGGATPPGYPVTVTNCGTPLTVRKPPARVVTNDIGITELMFALGLGDRMAGYVVDKGQSAGVASSPWKTEFGTVPHLAEKINREVVQGADADLVFAGWNYGFSEATGFTPDALAGLGIASYQLTEACRNGAGKQRGIMPPLDALYTDMRNLGKIFGVSDRAEKMIQEYRSQVASVAEAIPHGSPTPKVFLYDDGRDQPFTAAKNAGPDEIITKSGGENIFSDVDDSWTTVSWEAVIQRAPDVILINDYGGEVGSVADKENFLRSKPGVRDIPAVRKGRFFALPYAALVEGPRNASAVVAFGRYLAGLRG